MDQAPIRSELEFKMKLQELRSRNARTVKIQFVKIDVKSTGKTSVPQLHFDQLKHIHRIVTTSKDEENNAEHYVRWYFDDGEEFDITAPTVVNVNLTQRQVKIREVF
jgi:hypothetical protein